MQLRKTIPRAVASDVPPGSQMETAVPARPASWVADVVVPVAQAAISGAIGGALVTWLAVRAGWKGDWVALWATLALIIAAVAWVLLLFDTRKLLWAVERLVGADLNRDGARGDPSKQRLEVHVKTGGYTRIVGADWLNIEDDRLLAFAAAAQRGRKLTDAAFGKDKTIFPDGMNEWRVFRSKLLEAGLIVPVSAASNSTCTWTAAGRAFVNRLVEHGQGKK